MLLPTALLSARISDRILYHSQPCLVVESQALFQLHRGDERLDMSRLVPRDRLERITISQKGLVLEWECSFTYSCMAELWKRWLGFANVFLRMMGEVLVLRRAPEISAGAGWDRALTLAGPALHNIPLDKHSSIVHGH